MSFASIAEILTYLGCHRHPTSRRRMYAADISHLKRYLETIYDINRTRHLGIAEIPREARITPDDLKMARAEMPIPTPKSEAEVPDYQIRLHHTNLFPNISRKLKIISDYSLAGQPMQWSNVQFLGHHAISSLPLVDYRKIYQSILPVLPESRRNIHENAVSRSLNPMAVAQPGQDKHFAMIIGPPGAGKSTIGDPFAHERITPHFTKINVDDMRAHFPEYEGWNSQPIHMESAYLTYGSLMHQAFDQNHHLIYDATGSNPSTMEKTLRMAKEHGYKNHLILVHRPAYESIAGVWNRFLYNPYGAKHPDKDPSRYVNPFWSYEHIGDKPASTYHTLKTSPLVDHHYRLDPDVIKGEKPVILEHGHA